MDDSCSRSKGRERPRYSPSEKLPIYFEYPGIQFIICCNYFIMCADIYFIIYISYGYFSIYSDAFIIKFIIFEVGKAAEPMPVCRTQF